MSDLYSLNGQIKNAKSRIFRRCLIKRRLLGTGIYESDWIDISEDVIKWGSVKKEVDASRVNSFKFSTMKLTFSNHDGSYNPADDEQSLWYGYSSQQRTLVRIEVGFVKDELGADGVWRQIELPGQARWDEAVWDVDGYTWDGQPAVYMGYISGDINLAGTNQLTVPIVPLTEAFRQFAARRLTGYNTSLTAYDFMTAVLRDQQDSSGNYLFRPFFGNTTTYWDIASTTVEYANLNTSTADDVKDSTAWDIVEKLAIAENSVPFVSADGIFKFAARNGNMASPTFHFFGGTGFSSEYGSTIKKIGFYGERFSKYYSRVSVQFRQDDTTTSFAIRESTFRVSGDSGPWVYGEKTLEVNNLWIPTLTVADVIAGELFDEYSALRKEIEITTSLVPHLDLLDRILVTYDTTPPSQNGLWDLYNWSDAATIGADELVWDDSGGDAIKLSAKEFRLISIEVNLDSGESKFVGRE